MKEFRYDELVNILKQKGKLREAGFITKFYVEGKNYKIIKEEMYLNSFAHCYKLKQRTKQIIQTHYGINVFLSN